MEAAKPSLQILVENRCLSAYDILYNVRGVQELVAWRVPEPLARSLYDVIEELHEQSNYVSKRNLKREVRASVGFEKFFEAKRREATKGKQRGAVIAEQPAMHEAVPDQKDQRATPLVRGAVAELKDQSDSYEEVKQRLEKDVLQLPIDTDSLVASDVIFKAAFITCSCTTTALPIAPDSESYEGFLRTLVQLQSAGKADEMKAIVRERVVVAKGIADRYVRRCEELCIVSAGDLMVRYVSQSL